MKGCIHMSGPTKYAIASTLLYESKVVGLNTLTTYGNDLHPPNKWRNHSSICQKSIYTLVLISVGPC